MTKQEWVCEGCGLSGAITYAHDADVMTVVHALEDHHDRLAREFAPHCAFSVHKVRVRNPELMDVFAWNRMVNSIEKLRLLRMPGRNVPAARRGKA